MIKKYYKILFLLPISVFIVIIIYFPLIHTYKHREHFDFKKDCFVLDNQINQAGIDFFNYYSHIRFLRGHKTHRNQINHLKDMDTFLRHSAGRKFESGKVMKYNSNWLLNEYRDYIFVYGQYGKCAEASEYMKKFIELAKTDFQILDTVDFYFLDPEKDNYIYYRIYRGMILESFGRHLAITTRCPLTNEIKSLYPQMDFHSRTYTTICTGPYIWYCIKDYYRLK